MFFKGCNCVVHPDEVRSAGCGCKPSSKRAHKRPCHAVSNLFENGVQRICYRVAAFWAPHGCKPVRLGRVFTSKRHAGWQVQPLLLLALRNNLTYDVEVLAARVKRNANNAFIGAGTCAAALRAALEHARQCPLNRNTRGCGFRG